MTQAELRERCPTVAEYLALTGSVGWKPRDEAAVSIALGTSLHAVCAESDRAIVGMGRVIGDGGLRYYLADVVVHPSHQRTGIGSRIVRALTTFVESVPFKNTWVGVFAVDGTAEFYARFGYRAEQPTGPAMYRWLNKSG